MANENFGLGFTVEPLAQWAEPTEGNQGPFGEIAIFIENENQGPFGEITPIISSESQGAFGELAFFNNIDMQGPFGELDTNGLCDVFSVLSGPEVSVLSGPGTSTASCP